MSGKIKKSLKHDIIWAVIIAIMSVITGVVVNLIRQNKLPFIQLEAYEIFVPCPLGEANPVSIKEIENFSDQRILFIDARSENEYNQGHLPEAINIPYEFLVIDWQAMQKLLEQNPGMIIVYGYENYGNEYLNIGEFLAYDINSAGLKNIYYLSDSPEEYQQYFE